jgi:hypothetical protein
MRAITRLKRYRIWLRLNEFYKKQKVPVLEIKTGAFRLYMYDIENYVGS